MKKFKIYGSLGLLPILSMGLIPLASCNKSTKPTAEEVTLNFEASEGVTIPSAKSIKFQKGKTWGQLKQENKIPQPEYDPSYEVKGWFLIENGDYISISDDYVPTNGVTVWFIAYNPETAKLKVKVTWTPDNPTYEEEPVMFIKGGSFKLFKQLHSIPEIPERDGYTFKVWKHGDQEINNDWEFPTSKEEVTIVAEFTKNDYTVKVESQDVTRGKIVDEHDQPLSSLNVPYKTKWMDLVNQGKVKPVAETGFKFYNWIDQKGNVIDSNYEILGESTITAVFIESVTKKVTFTTTDEGELTGQTDPIDVELGTKWGDVPASSKPTGTPKANMEKLGWFAIQGDKYEPLTDDYIVTDDFTAKYVAYDPAQTRAITFKIDPDKEAMTLYFMPGRTFKEFRQYYGINDSYYKEGYEFKGWYNGDTKLEDDTVIPNKTTVADYEIHAQFKAIQYTINLFSLGNGSVNKQSIVVDKGTTWAKALADNLIEVTPDPFYEFNKWVDSDGKEIKDDAVINVGFNAYAYFVDRKVHFTIVSEKTRDYFLQHDSVSSTGLDVAYSDTHSYDPNSTYWDIRNSESTGQFLAETNRRDNDKRVLAHTIEISVPLSPHTTKTTKYEVTFDVHVEVNGFVWGSDGDIILQLFQLANRTDDVELFSSWSTPQRVRDLDKRCFFSERMQFNKTAKWSEWTDDASCSATFEYTDTNDTDTMVYAKHYITMSILADRSDGGDRQYRVITTLKNVE